MVGGGQGCWVKGGGAIIFFFFSGGRGARNIIILCVFQFIPTSSEKKLKPNSFVCLPIHSYVFPPKRSLNPNSFVCLQIHSYIFQKKTLHLNSFVCIPIHSYVFQFIRMSSRRGWWVEGGDGGWRGGERLYLFILGGEGGRGTLLFCVYSNAFVCLPIHSYVFGKKLKPNSFVCLPIHWGGVAPPNQDYYFAVHSYVFQFMGLDGGTPPRTIIYYYFAEIIRMNRFRFIIIISRK